MSKHWTPQEIKTLKESYLKMEYEALGGQIGRTGKAVQVKLSKMGLGNKRKQVPAISIQRPPAEYSNTGNYNLTRKYA